MVAGAGDDSALGVVVDDGSPLAGSPSFAGTGVDITSPLLVTTTICTSSFVAPAAGIVSAFASSGVTDFTS